MLQNAAIQQELSGWASSNARLKVLAGCYQSRPNAGPCGIVRIDDQAPPPPTKAEESLAAANTYLQALEQYAKALSALAGSTDPATATKNAQAIGSSLNGLASAVGSAYSDDKTKAQNAAASIGGTQPSIRIFYKSVGECCNR
jgi:hypothetical protein